MKSLTTASSVHFVNGYTPVASAMSTSVQDYLNSVTTKTFQEGTSAFDHLRCSLLRETEQSLMMAQNCYARALEGLRGGSSFWALVTLYYSAFFSIKAILGTYGCWMAGPKRWIEVLDPHQEIFASNIKLRLIAHRTARTK